MPEPESAAGKAGVKTAWKAGNATNNAGTSTIDKKTSNVTPFRDQVAFE